MTPPRKSVPSDCPDHFSRFDSQPSSSSSRFSITANYPQCFLSTPEPKASPTESEDGETWSSELSLTTARCKAGGRCRANRIRQSRSVADERSDLSGHRLSDRLQCSATLARTKPLILGSQPVVPKPTAFLTLVSHGSFSRCLGDHRHSGNTRQATPMFVLSHPTGRRAWPLRSSCRVPFLRS